MLQHFSQQGCLDEAPPYRGTRRESGGGYSIMQVEGNERLLGGCGSAPSRLAGWAPVA